LESEEDALQIAVERLMHEENESLPGLQELQVIMTTLRRISAFTSFYL